VQHKKYKQKIVLYPTCSWGNGSSRQHAPQDHKRAGR